MTVEEMAGAVVLDHYRSIVELSHFIHRTEATEPLDVVFTRLRASYKRLSYDQRCEFALVAILHCDLDASASLQFTSLIMADANRIATDLQRIPDETLITRFGMPTERIQQFRRYLEKLRTIQADTKPPGHTQQPEHRAAVANPRVQRIGSLT